MIIYFADWLSHRIDTIPDLLRSAFPFGVMTTGICILVVAQPDLGTATVLTVTAVALFFLAGADLHHLAVGAVAGMIALVGLALDAGYRSQRLSAFLDASGDPLGVGWNITQAQIALGSGGIWGLGLGAGRQKFYYLPNAHTDAIFAVVGEELGLAGTLAVLALFIALAARGYRAALRAPDQFGLLLAAGITTTLVIQALINVGGITATVPFTGIPLPFVSYGGSSLVVSLAQIGILLNVSRQSRDPAIRLARESFHDAERAVTT
jgi:cell division protein FtsW